jgi:3-oxoacyl-[acyl-carrier protein] reductase
MGRSALASVLAGWDVFGHLGDVSTQSTQPWAPPAGELDAVLTELGGLGDRLGHVSADFAEASAPRDVIQSVIERFGAIDVLIVNHARSSSGGLDWATAAELDLSWSVNARAAVLLAQAYSEHHDDARDDGRVVLFTSGQHLGPMPDELAYAVSKGAIHQMTCHARGRLGEPRDHRERDQPRTGRHRLAHR